mmetsp:Transcript_46219/g.114985  ORF Transcript_46219/g.114985 Transcript_46219/m.114985 type:complete len:83 (-) Transcript_46219:212-460(-)
MRRRRRRVDALTAQARRDIGRALQRPDRNSGAICSVSLVLPSVCGADSSRHATVGSDGMAMPSSQTYGGTWKAVIGDVPRDD